MLASKILKTSKTKIKASTIHERLLRQAGFIQKLSAGIYQLLPLGFLVYKKIYQIIEEELSKIGFLPFLGPMVQPAKLWRQTKRWDDFGQELLRFKNRYEEDFVLAPTHEENVSLMAKSTIQSFRDLPKAFNQIQPKFRDEPRPRGGLIRLREFTMQDGYSFHRDQKDMDLFYEKVKKAYLKIFKRCGLNIKIVQSAVDAMGGTKADEFMVIAPVGENRIALCNQCNYAANLEVARFKDKLIKEKPKPQKIVRTPNTSTIEALSKFLKIESHCLAKIVFFVNEKNELIAGLILGDREINEKKLALASNSKELVSAPESKIRKMGFEPGFAKPIASGKNVKIIFDKEVWESNNLVTGTNKKDSHILNFNPKRDSKIKNPVIADIAEAKNNDSCPHCKGKLKIKNSIEVGNIFQLGDKYTRSLEVRFTDEKGKILYPIEGCYGIGLERLIATIVEIHNDAKGIIWPEEIAPFDIYLIYLDGEREKAIGQKLYQELGSIGKKVIFDDRNNSAGEKFADADLIGAPYRVIVSKKTLENEQVEIKSRKEKTVKKIDLKKVVDYFKYK